MTANELRQKFIEFFVSKGHKEIPPASLVPENDPTTLFTSSGMQPLIPYLKGEKHPMGKRLVDSQPSFRAEDIEEVGDNRHTTFFEMLGNWSLGDYYKEEQIAWFWEFLTKVLRLPPAKLHVTIFDGDKNLKRETNVSQSLAPDVESKSRWLKLGVSESHIHWYGSDKNWWSRSGTPDKMPEGEIGGPDSEVFFDFGADLKIHENSSFKNKPCHINCNCGRFLEIGNSVFMEYEKTKTGFTKLPQKNVDFGGGLERILAAKQNSPDVFKTELFLPIIKEIEKASGKAYLGNEKSMQVIADHLKAAVFMVNEGLEPSNKRQGYILRRLIRRAAVKMLSLDINQRKSLSSICNSIINIYKQNYLKRQNYNLYPIIGKEIDTFSLIINKGIRMLQTKPITGKLLFDLQQSYGYPLEIALEQLQQWGKPANKKIIDEYKLEMKQHQEKSRTASAGMFKGGLADHSETITKLHTATHLLHAALRKILGSHVGQAGSNITQERLRFDFTHPQALTSAQLKSVEDLVNEQIKKNLKVSLEINPLKEAQKKGALAFFGQKYPEKVKVYRISPSTGSGQGFSLEICAGPHVSFTGTLGRFKIKKEESCGSGKRRLYGVLE